jgi:TM2 domain-containing membrane protein YozV
VKKATKAALLSGLVFPGIGHLYLKRYVQGILLSAGAAFASCYIVTVVVTAALDAAEKIQSGGVRLDMDAISGLVSQQMGGAEHTVNVAMITLGVLWVAGIVDSYRQGRAHEKG